MNNRIPFKPHDPDDYDWFLRAYEHSLRKNRAIFLKMVYKTLFDADTPLEAAMGLVEVDSPVELVQKVLQVDTPLEAAMRLMEVDSPIELAQKFLKVDSPVEVALKLLEAGSPIEVALKAIQNEEQFNELLSRLEQTSYQSTTTSS